MPTKKPFIWSKEEYTLREFVECYKYQLPLVVRVTQGYCGYDKFEYTFGNGDVYHISHINTQTRVVTKDSTDRRLSIPVNYPVKFHRLQYGNRMPAMTFADMFKSSPYKPGMQVEPENRAKLSFWIGADSTMKTNIETLELVDKFDDKYLVGNAICAGDMYEPAVDIPLFLTIKLSIAEGLEKGTSDEFQKVIDGYRKESNNFKNETVEGNPEIMLYEADQSDMGEYAYVEPKTYISCGELAALRKQISEKKTTQEKKEKRPPPPPKPKLSHQAPQRSDDANVYDTVEMTQSRPPPQPSPKDKKERHKKFPFPKNLPFPHLKHRTPPVGSDSNTSNTANDAHLYTSLNVTEEAQSSRSGEGTGSVRSKHGVSYFTSLDKVPNSLKGVPKRGIADCLRFINLDKYVKTFMDQDIDGDLLISLEKKVFEDDLGMSKLASTKLYKFVHESWRPKE